MPSRSARRFMLLATTLVVLLVPVSGALAATVTVTPSSPNGWGFENRNNGSQATVPAPAGGLGPHALQQQTGDALAANNPINPTFLRGGKALAFLAGAAGQPIHALSSLEYSTYIQSALSPSKVVTSINIPADLDGNGTFDHMLIYEPGHANLNGPTAPVAGAWQHWNALDNHGGWWVAPGTASCPTQCNASLQTALGPDWLTAKIAPAGQEASGQPFNGGITFVAGQRSGPSEWDDYTGLVDDVRIGFDGADNQYDFESDSTPPPVVNIDWPRDGGWYSSYKDVESDWSCSSPSGHIISHTASAEPGHPFDRSPGWHDFTVTCIDDNENTTTKTVHYYVTDFPHIVNRGHLIAYYRLNELPRTSPLLDYSGNHHDGEYKNATASEPYGISGDGDRARHFIGDGGYGYVNGIAAPSDGLTLGGWVKFDDTGDADVLDHGYDAGIYVRNRHFVFRMLGTSVTDPGQIDADRWYFVAGTWNGFKMKLWVVGGAPGIHNLPSFGSNVATQPKQPTGISTFYIGYGQDEPWLRGAMDEVFYFDYDLSENYLDELWLADPPASPGGHRVSVHVSPKARVAHLKAALAKAQRQARTLQRHHARAIRIRQANARVVTLKRQLAVAKKALKHRIA